MTNIATMKAMTNPIVSNTYSKEVNKKPAFKSEYRDAPNSVGMARKNENSTAVFLSTPRAVEPMILAAALDTPGMRAKHCKTPIKNDLA